MFASSAIISEICLTPLVSRGQDFKCAAQAAWPKTRQRGAFAPSAARLNREADAHAVLAPAVEGFPSTQQFPELTEAQAVLAALSP
jgi:hypothetical protein